jgi:hypothetical protein
MGYLGNSPQNQAFTPRVDYFSGNGSTTAFTLSFPVASVAQVQAVIENVPQKPGDAYTVSGNTITFTSAPPSGTNNIYVYYTSPITQVVTPGQGTVNTLQLVDGAVTQDKLAAGAGSQWATTGSDIYYNTGNVGIGTSSPINNSGYGGLTLNGTSGSLFSLMTNGTETGRIASLSDETSVQCKASTGYITFVQGVSGGTERGRFDSSGNFRFNSGFGSVATAYGCRAWVNFNGTNTPAIRASGNVSSITDNGTGLFTANYTTAMPDGNYTSNITTRYTGSGDTLMSCIQGSSFSTSSISARIMNSSFNLKDPTEVSIAIFR